MVDSIKTVSPDISSIVVVINEEPVQEAAPLDSVNTELLEVCFARYLHVACHVCIYRRLLINHAIYFSIGALSQL